MADNLSPFLVGGPLGGFKPKRDVDAEAIRNFGTGQAAGLLGFPADLLQLIAMTANRGIGRPPVELPLTSDKLAKKFGADPDRLATMMGMVGTPDPGDIARLTGKGLLAQALFHGTPHKFNKFELEKIGTGSGTQAYGHGLYFAESPGVAKSYQSGLSAKQVQRNFLDALPEDAEFDEVVELVGTGYFTPDQDAVIKALEKDDWLGFDYPSQAVNAAYSGNLSRWDASDELKKAVSEAGHLYEVDIPDETIAKMLDWDAPLSEQPESVRKVLIDELNSRTGPQPLRASRSADGTIKTRAAYKLIEEDASGAEIYTWLTDDLWSDARLKGNAFKDGPGTEAKRLASNRLNEAGIPGIRFYDGNSRNGLGQNFAGLKAQADSMGLSVAEFQKKMAAGEIPNPGTRNIVVFNPDDITQVKRDGELVYKAKGL